MKKTIYILVLICVLTLLPSCGESGEPQENRPGFSEKDSEAEAANSMDKPQFAAEEPDEIGVSEITLLRHRNTIFRTEPFEHLVKKYPLPVFLRAISWKTP